MGSPGSSDGRRHFPYAGLADQFQDRKERYLTMLASWPRSGEPDQIVARMRGYLLPEADSSADSDKGWARLRSRPNCDWLKAKDVWLNALAPADRKRRLDRFAIKPFTTVWSDDPVARAQPRWPVGEEDVNLTTARLAAQDLAHAMAFPGESRFPKPFGVDLQDLDRPMSAKLLLQTILELLIERRGPDGPRLIKDVMLAAVDAARVECEADAAMAKGAVIASELRTNLNAWWDKTSATPTSEELFGIKALDGEVPGYDPRAMLFAYGFDITRQIFDLRRVAKKSGALFRMVFPTEGCSNLLAWLAWQAKLPAREALVAIADLQTFQGFPTYEEAPGSWKPNHNPGLTPPLKPPKELPPDAPGALFARLLSCLYGDQLSFCFDPDIEVPEGWVWPDSDADGIYWWSAVLRPNLGEHILKLKDTADFKVTDVLRFGFLYGGLSGPPDPRVPTYVAECIKASLLQFKYWIDEPRAHGNDGGEMTFWSENHQVQFHAAEYLVGSVFATKEFKRSGWSEAGPVTGRDHQTLGRERVLRWLDRRLRYGFSEWNAPGYYNEDFPPLLNLVDFAEDDVIRTKAAMVLDRLVFDLARFTCRGSFASSAGRCYYEHKGYGWEHSIGETVEVLFGSRGDHIAGENTAIALCTSTRYEVPEALLAIGLDRMYVDNSEPSWDRSRSSITEAEGKAAGIGKETLDDVAFWWGLGVYFTEEMLESTKRTAAAYENLRLTPPMNLLWSLETLIPLLGGFPAPLRSLLLDGASLTVGTNVAAGSGLLCAISPFPLNLLFGSLSLASVGLTIQSVIHLLEDLGTLIADGLAELMYDITGDAPPPPHIPDSALQVTLESLLELFNRGNVLTRANLASFSVGDAMLSSVQSHRPGEISFQKLPWIASLGLEACIWTNAPLTASGGGYALAEGWEIFKHMMLLQGSDAMVDGAKIFGLANMDDLRKEGLYEWGGSICLPRIMQYRDAAIIAYDFDTQTRSFSKTPTHAWFPVEFFDEVDPIPTDEAWMSEGSWVFGRKGRGYVALYSARPVQWLQDHRFDDDPARDDPSRKVRDEGRFTSTELRAETGSNFWVCAIGNADRFGSFAGFADAIRRAPLSVSGIGNLDTLKLTFEMPAAANDPVGSFRMEFSPTDGGATVNGYYFPLDEFPRFENRYVEGRRPQVVEWDETTYRIRHSGLGLFLEHDIAAGRRTLGPHQLNMTPKVAPNRLRHPHPIASMPSPGTGAARPVTDVIRGRRRRFRLATPPI